MSEPKKIPDDDPARDILVRRGGEKQLPTVGMVGDVYSVVVSGDHTGGAYTLIDMRVPPGGGPGPHRHNFEELFIVHSGTVTFFFRGEQHDAGAGDVVNIPANAPHFFRNKSDDVVRMSCVCTPAGQDAFFLAVGVPLPDAEAEAPPLSEQQMQLWQKRAAELAPRYATELLQA